MHEALIIRVFERCSWSDKSKEIKKPFLTFPTKPVNFFRSKKQFFGRKKIICCGDSKDLMKTGPDGDLGLSLGLVTSLWLAQ